MSLRWRRKGLVMSTLRNRRVLTGLFLSSAVISGCTTSDASSGYWPGTPPEISSALYSRAGITVANMDKSLKFYRDALGMTVLVDRVGKTDARLAAFSGVEQDQAIRLVILRTETRGPAQLNAGYIGLAEITAADGSTIQNREVLTSNGAETGAIMLMFVVEDVRAVHADILGLGLEIISEPQQREDGSWSELLIRGPNQERLWITDRYSRDVLVEKTVP